MIGTFIGALMIGVTLGLLGSGGSAITVPILVYLVGHDAKIAIAESMAIVGLISIAGAIPFARSKQIDWTSVLLFGLPAVLGTYLGAYLGGKSNDALQLFVFGFVLILTSVVMLRKAFGKQKEAPEVMPETAKAEMTFKGFMLVLLEGITVGTLTGFVGVGGGFLIVPALLILGKLPMRTAIGTSLVIIFMKSTIGFARYQYDLLQHDQSVHWDTIGIFLLIGLLGCALGQMVNKKLNQNALVQVFAVFLIVIGGYVIVNEGSKFFRGTDTTTPTTSEPVKG